MSDDPNREKTWRLLALTVSREAEELAGSLLFEMKVNGILTLEEGPTSVKLGAYFDERADLARISGEIRSRLAALGEGRALLDLSISTVADQDWMQKWKEGFEAVAVGERLIISPSWKLPDETFGREVIEIDPGMAFGTGTHETTRMCLEAIERHWRGGKMIDVGTGTGILAIAAAKLAPGSRISAIDVDPLAVEAARSNAAINGVEAALEITEGQPRGFREGAFDVVAANLTAEVIIDLFDDLSACLAPSGSMILSGILTTLRNDVEARAAEAGLAIVERREAGEWSALVARREGE
ncbi:MAG TPA: 50S ribosomal protein L11 methyltransferase [Blastocatellia bacterium]|nr:50S ribosomal protein L11 methyltransferase [Blastocatellia bacterium]